MRRILVIAHKTLLGAHLLEEVERRSRDAGGALKVHVVVPVHHPNGAWTDGEVERAAAKVLEEGLARFREHAIDATGEVGDADPVYAVEQVVLHGGTFDEIVVSTLRPSRSAWLKRDVVARLQRHYRVPVAHVLEAVPVP